MKPKRYALHFTLDEMQAVLDRMEGRPQDAATRVLVDVLMLQLRFALMTFSSATPSADDAGGDVVPLHGRVSAPPASPEEVA